MEKIGRFVYTIGFMVLALFHLFGSVIEKVLFDEPLEDIEERQKQLPILVGTLAIVFVLFILFQIGLKIFS